MLKDFVNKIKVNILIQQFENVHLNIIMFKRMIECSVIYSYNIKM